MFTGRARVFASERIFLKFDKLKLDASIIQTFEIATLSLDNSRSSSLLAVRGRRGISHDLVVVTHFPVKAYYL